VRRLLHLGEWDEAPYRLFYNVNFPPCAAAEVRGTRVTAQGRRTDAGHGMSPHVSPSGRRFLYVTGGPQQTPTAPGTDAAAALGRHISVTPMRADLTAHDRLDAMREALE